MERENLVQAAQVLIENLNRSLSESESIVGAYAQACEFLRTFAGPKSSFLLLAEQYNPRSASHGYVREHTVSILENFINYVNSGLHQEISPERQAQIEVVSDFLEQAHNLLENEKIHPGAAAILVGASLEEFLRTWAEAIGIPVDSRKHGLDYYTKKLRSEEKISKQDVKDITSWAGIRNHAAHGEWENVKDRQRIRLMLEGVNLFMRKYQTAGASS